MSIWEGESPAVCNRRVVRARKQHQCCECGCRIPPGVNYEFVRGLWGETWDTFRTCSWCVLVRAWVVELVGADEVPIYGGLWEAAFEVGES